LRERYIPAFIVLLAGAVTSIINIVNKVELVTGLERLLLVIIIFYFVGLIVKAIIKMALTKFAKKDENEASEETKEEGKQPEGKQPEAKQPEGKKS
jgi:phosphotransferase system  glucose/maltose/N-acetylglucosamine-specific IIC component